jgi:hypothetical protein
MAGYSGTPLAKKLGFRSGYRVRISHAPDNYDELVAVREEGVLISKNIRKNIGVWHFFARSSAQLEEWLPQMMRSIRQDGMIWVSWPKKSSGVPSTVTEDTVRRLAPCRSDWST